MKSSVYITCHDTIGLAQVIGSEALGRVGPVKTSLGFRSGPYKQVFCGDVKLI